LRQRAMALLAVGAVALALIGVGAPWLQRTGVGQLTALMLSSVGYAAAIGLIVWLWPELAGLSRAQIVHGIRSLRRT
jgi:hypothetical protein